MWFWVNPSNPLWNRGGDPCWPNRGLQRSNEIAAAMYVTNLKRTLHLAAAFILLFRDTGTSTVPKTAEGLPWLHRLLSVLSPLSGNALPLPDHWLCKYRDPVLLSWELWLAWCLDRLCSHSSLGTLSTSDGLRTYFPNKVGYPREHIGREIPMQAGSHIGGKVNTKGQASQTQTVCAPFTQ